MKRFALLFLLTLGVALPARAEVSVSLNFFVDALEPHGSWIDVQDYGYCWRPRVAEEDPEWRPYTEGHWAYTDGGWTWISDEDWGWATYHYGRWLRVHDRWCWVPGYEWAPAWVSWRENDESLGWAPLPPEARWDARIGFSSWTDGYYDVGPDYYSFVPRRHFGNRSLRSHYLDRRRNAAIFGNSVNITRIVHREDVVNNIFVGGPRLDRIERDGGGRIERLQLRRDTSGIQREWREDASRGPRQHHRTLSRIEGDQLIVAAPKVDREAKFSPPRRVAERLGKQVIDRGWRGVDPEEKDRLRRSVRANAERNLPRGLPERPQSPRTAWAVPSAPSSGPDAEEIRRPAQPDRRLQDTPPRSRADNETPRPSRPNPRVAVPEPGLSHPPAEKPIPPTRLSPREVKPDASRKSIPPARPQSKTVPGEPEPRVEGVAPPSPRRKFDHVPQVNVPARPIVPRRPAPRASDDPAVQKERPRPTPRTAAPLPPPQITAPLSPTKVQGPRNGDRLANPKRVQVQPRSESKPRGSEPRPASSRKKTAPPSDEEEKRKHKKP